ncbi:MAG: dTMP kinase [Candidatus Margulisiibacteriota bacterium]
MFITFEGCEGCGKSTQIGLLAKYLESQGLAVVTTREPGGTVFGQTLREILLADRPSAGGPASREAELFLFAADRAEHVATIIQPALSSGKIVLCDRYLDSTSAYQIGGRGLPEDLVHYINFISSGGLVPDLTIFLDLPVAEGLKRVGKRGGETTGFDKEQLDFHARVYRAYCLLAEQNPSRIRRLDASLTIAALQAQVATLVQEARLR